MKILITTSTLPAHDRDPVPAFVKDQAINLKKLHPDTEIILHAPHNHYSKTTSFSKHDAYTELRFHYFWPFRLERLAGRGILPALKKNKLLYLQVPFFFIAHFFSLLHQVRRIKPDLVYAHWFTPQAISAAIVAKITCAPFVFTTHASDVSVLKVVPFSSRLVAWVCTRAESFTSVSARTMGKLENAMSQKDWANVSEKHEIIPMGVITSNTQPSNKAIKKVIGAYDLDEDKFTILFVGRLAEKKGVTYLLDALTKVPENDAEKIQVVIAGDGQLLPALKSQAEKLTTKATVKFTGYVHGGDKDGLFAFADAVCLPSIIDSSGDAEGLPVVLMEALAAGKIALASTSSGAEDVLTDKVDGMLFPERSAEAIADAIQSVMRLTDKQRREMQKAAGNTAIQFNWDIINEKYYSLFKKALASDSSVQ